MGNKIVDFLKSLWGDHVRPRLALILGEVLDDLGESELFELMVEKGRIAVRQLMTANIPDESKRNIVEDQIRAELALLGQQARGHLVETARLFAYRSVAREMEGRLAIPDFGPLDVPGTPPIDGPGAAALPANPVPEGDPPPVPGPPAPPTDETKTLSDP